MKIRCPEFDNESTIPERFSQYGANQSPPLDFQEIPADARSLALILDDPDAPRGLFTHWVVLHLDPKTSRLGENQLPAGTRQGVNSYGQAKYAGPKPPDREHRYFFHLYALRRQLDLPDGASRADLERAMTGQVLAEATLMGRFAPPVVASK